jgi:hypothetical protein
MAGIWTSATLAGSATMAEIGPPIGMKPLLAFFFFLTRENWMGVGREITWA